MNKVYLRIRDSYWGFDNYAEALAYWAFNYKGDGIGGIIECGQYRYYAKSLYKKQKGLVNALLKKINLGVL